MTTALIVLACIAFWAIIAFGVHLKLFRGFVKSNQARSLFDFDVWRVDSGVWLVTLFWFMFPVQTFYTLTSRVAEFPPTRSARPE